jgi:hypothetical protein
VSLSISDYKTAAEMLGRFANVREGAPEPTDRILIQFDTVIKFVAGDDHSTVIVDTGTPVSSKGKALVSARLFLQAAKTLRGKGELTFELDGKGGAVLKTHTGGKVVLPRIADALPGWVRPSEEPANAIVLETPDGLWPDLSKVIGVGPGKHYWPWDMVHFEQYEGQLSLVWTDNYRWVSYPLARGLNLSGYTYFGSVPVEFVKSLKAFEGATGFTLSKDRMHVSSGASHAVSRLVWATDPKAGKTLFEQARLGGQRPVEVYSGATVSRKDFIDNLKAVSSADEHGRVTAMVEAGAVKVYGYGHERDGSMTMNASMTQGRGYISFNEELATKLLSGLKDKEVTFLFPMRGMGPVQFKESKWGWQMYLAPIAL